MSSHEPPDALAFKDLEQLVRGLGEELARFRRRALAAEAQLKQQQSVLVERGADPATADRVAVLEAENAALRERLATAAERTETMLERLRFLRQQTHAAESA